MTDNVVSFVSYQSYLQNVRLSPSFEGSYMLTLDETSEQSKETIPSLRSHSLYQKLRISGETLEETRNVKQQQQTQTDII